MTKSSESQIYVHDMGERGAELRSIAILCKRCRAICVFHPGEYEVEMNCFSGMVYVKAQCVRDGCRDDLAVEIVRD